MSHARLPIALAMLLAAGAASAQVYQERDGLPPYGDYSQRDDRYPQQTDSYGSYGDTQQGHYEWARVLSVDPVFDGRTQPVYDNRRCQTRRDGYASRDGYGDRYGDGYGDYRTGDYRDDNYRNDRYGYRYDPYGQSRRDDNGRMVATVLGGIAGAVLGSRIGDGSGQYIGTAVGSMVGGMAGRGIYESNRRARDREGYVTVCEPDGYGSDRYDTYGRDPDDQAVQQYRVTYEYGGREYTTHTRHHPGDRIRVRVDVSAE